METVGLGLFYEDLPIGREFRTIGRTVTEADIVNFINCTGMTEVLFIDMEFLANDSDIKGRVAPAALSYTFAEELDVKAPVFAGDTIHAECEVIEARRTSKPGRGLVRTRNKVVKQDGTVALVYTPLRLIKCREAAAG